MGDMQNTLIVVPCYNEEERLSIEKFLEMLANNHQLSFLFVNDGSIDGTDKLLNAAASRLERITVLNLEKNFGKAEAVRRGITASTEKPFRYIGFWDADLATPLYIIEEMIRVADKESAKLVIGSRLKRMGSRIQRKTLRHYAGRLFSTAAYFCTFENIYDAQCGAKLFLNDACLKAVFREKFSVSWIFDTEIIARYSEISRNQGRESLDGWLVEWPLNEWRDVPGSKLRVWDFVIAGVDLIRLFKKYSPIIKSRRSGLKS